MNTKFRSIAVVAAALAVTAGTVTACSQAKNAASSATAAAGSAIAGATSAVGSAVSGAGAAAGSAAKGADESKPAVDSTEVKTEAGQSISITNAPILAEWAKYGYASGHLGAPLGPVSPLPDAGGKYLTLKGGTIYWSEASGAHVVHGAIGDKWGKVGYERGKLGYPTSDEVDAADGTITQKFQHGEITFKDGDTTISYN
ncbi:LGFP repeat-containing protein [Tsukamurella soli]|uniref:LGFP repeat-containing protein n=1 Tax=Tsukamurella soli TaxID=644556 RepID=A0ABP8KG78_9ACTN